jgi:AcrR family transcriptional regulator
VTKEAVVEAAFRVWGREYYQTTSLSPLARELGVSKPALYRHFKSKQALMDALYTRFFDDYAAHIRDAYTQARGTELKTEGIFIILRAVASYYIQKPEAFVFSVSQVYYNRDFGLIRKELADRGILPGAFWPAGGVYPSALHLIMASVVFWIVHFHKCAGDPWEPPSEARRAGMLALIEDIAARGLGLNREKAAFLDFERLEGLAAGAGPEGGREAGIIKAVAGVVAEAGGPRKASMDKVARRLGLSKSGLYSHFKSKQDMLRRMFLPEIEGIVGCAESKVRLSAKPEERLYLALASVAGQLRARPEIFVALDWLRLRRINLEMPDTPPAGRIFGDLRLEGAREISEPVAQWMLFLTLSTLLMGPLQPEKRVVSNESIRILYKFITLGICGYDS